MSRLGETSPTLRQFRRGFVHGPLVSTGICERAEIVKEELEVVPRLRPKGQSCRWKKEGLGLPPEAVDTWLTGTPDQAKELLVPYPSELMRAHRVSKRVNKPENDDPNLLVELGLGPTQLSLES